METPQNDFQIYRPINDTWQAVFSLEGDIGGGPIGEETQYKKEGCDRRYKKVRETQCPRLSHIKVYGFG